MSIEVIAPKDFAPTEQLLWVNKQCLGDIKDARKEGVREGMIDKKPPYYLYVRQRSKLSKRKESTLNPNYMKIGTVSNPTQYEYITGGDWETVVDASTDALAMLRRISPIKTGNFVSLMNVYVNGRITTIGGLKKQNNTEGAVVTLTNVVEYATALEHGFYVGRYDNGRYKGQGIFLQVTRLIRKMYGNKISLRFSFISTFGGTQPAIEIAAAGAFAGNDSKPNSGSRRKGR